MPESVTDIKTYQKVKCYFPSIDRIVTEFQNRFAENDKDNLCALGSLIFDSEICEKEVETVAVFYTLDKDALSTDLKLYKHFKV